MEDKKFFEMLTAICTFIAIFSAACMLITLFNLDITNSMVWSLFAVSSTLGAFTFYSRYEES